MSAPNIGYVAADVEELTPEALVAGLKSAGYDAVDWTMEQFDPLADPPERLVELTAIAAAAGLAVPQLMVHQDYVTADAALWEQRVSRTERAIVAAATAGIGTVGVVCGPNRWVAGWEELDSGPALQLVVVALRRALAAAAGSGVRVCLEPCWGTIAADRTGAERVIEAVGSDELALTLDPSHFAITADDVVALARDWAGRIGHVHLKDAFGVPGTEGEDFLFLLPGEGVTDWRALLAALDAGGYSGAMSVEFESFRLREQVFGGDVIAAARLAREHVCGLIAGIRAAP